MRDYRILSSLNALPELAERSHVNPSPLRGIWQSFVQKVLRDFLWKNFVNTLLRDAEPKIWRKRDRKGNLFFQVYDPKTGQVARLDSEHEIRIWIEERYRH
jgi:hypothetical protein